MSKCGCGRSPTGMCKGWHGLSKEEYEQKGFNESSEELLTNYKNALNLFEAEFEI